MGYNKEEKESIWKWIKGSLFVGAFGFLTAWLIFPLAWIFRGMEKRSIFWWWMDDERIGASDYKSYLIRYGLTEENFKIAYKWHIRNALWNLKRDRFLVDSTTAESGNNNIVVVSTPIDEFVKFNSDGSTSQLQQNGKWIVSPGLKFIPSNEDEDIWQVNQGDEISYLTSILGEGMLWFYPTGKDQLMFRYGHCKIVDYNIFGWTIWKGWRTLKLGYGNKSYVMTIKHQKIKPWA